MRNWILFKLGDQGVTMTSLTRMLISKYIRKPKDTKEPKPSWHITQEMVTNLAKHSTVKV